MARPTRGALLGDYAGACLPSSTIVHGKAPVHPPLPPSFKKNPQGLVLHVGSEARSSAAGRRTEPVLNNSGRRTAISDIFRPAKAIGAWGRPMAGPPAEYNTPFA